MENNEKDTIIFRLSWARVIRTLPAEAQIEVYDAIADYASGAETAELSPLAAVAFGFIKGDIDRDGDKYEKTCERRREAGRRGSAKRWNTEAADAEPIASSLSADTENGGGDTKDAKNGKNSNCHNSDAKNGKNSKNSNCHFAINENGKHSYNDCYCYSDSDSDCDNDSENEKDKSFSCYSLTPNPFEGASEKEKQKNSLSRVFFFRNFRDPSAQAAKFLAYNNTGKRRWAKMDETERQSCIDLWQPQGADGKPLGDRSDPDDLRWWGEVWGLMAESGAPPEVMLSAVDDTVGVTVRGDTLFLHAPQTVYEYIERNLERFKPLLQRALDRRRCRNLNYKITKK